MVSVEAKDFLRNTCVNVIKQYNDHLLIEQLKFFLLKVFYANMVEKTQVKIWIYKLLEYKMKKVTEERMDEFSCVQEDKKRLKDSAMVQSKTFINSITFKTLSSYRAYIARIKLHVIKIQARFKGYLYRLINKMELMNMRIEKQNLRAKQKARQSIKFKK